MAKLNLNLQSAVAYLYSQQVLALDGLWHVIVAKLAELGVKEDGRAVRRVSPVLTTDSPTGSLASIIAWVRCLQPLADGASAEQQTVATQDQGNLQVLHAVLLQRFGQSGYTPKAPAEEEPAEE